ncbi:hypothetical protein F9L02_01140 [Brucella intermedia]|nr:hypothetical protein F9L02_01140 [Brucella intermedia]
MRSARTRSATLDLDKPLVLKLIQRIGYILTGHAVLDKLIMRDDQLAVLQCSMQGVLDDDPKESFRPIATQGFESLGIQQFNREPLPPLLSAYICCVNLGRCCVLPDKVMPLAVIGTALIARVKFSRHRAVLNRSRMTFWTA